MKLDAYIRVSRVGGREGESYITKKQQRDAIERWCGLQGYKIAHWHEEEDRSGGDASRPKWNEALRRALAGEVDGVIVAKLDRFARSAVDGLKAVTALEDAGRTFVSVAEKFDTADPYGRFTATIFFALAELELERIKAGWADTWRRRIERGAHSGSRIPAGYKRNDDQEQLVPSEHAGAVTAAFEARARGASMSEVARGLTEACVPTFSGKPWSGAAARGLLGNRVYLGEARFGARVKKNAHDALVGPALFRAVEAAAGKAPSKGDGIGPLLGGLIKCGSCGGSMSRDYTTTRGSAGERYAFYRCKSNPACTGRATIMQKAVEDYVTASALKHVGDIHYDDPGSDTAALQTAVADAQAELAEVEEAAADMTPVAYGRALTVAEKRLAAAEDALAAAASPRHRHVTAEDFERVFEEEMPVEDQRKVLGAVIERVEVRKGRGPAEDRVEILYRDREEAAA
jgi:DNA invertase Pin-like site-specific DNA recombinase